jgi:hypothetical protein
MPILSIDFDDVLIDGDGAVKQPVPVLPTTEPKVEEAKEVPLPPKNKE